MNQPANSHTTNGTDNTTSPDSHLISQAMNPKGKATNPKKKPSNTQTETPKGTYVLAVDCKNLYSRKRHTDPEAVKQECKRLANELGERVLVLQVVGVYDKRKKAKVAEPTGVAETESK